MSRGVLRNMNESALDFVPMSLLDEDLSSPDRSARLRGVRGLRSLASAVGLEKTRDELMPVVHAHIRKEEDDEVLYEFADVLGNFMTELGGPEHVIMLYSPLRDLAKVEETVVHTRATCSLIKIFDATSTTVTASTSPKAYKTTEDQFVDATISVLAQLSGAHSSTSLADTSGYHTTPHVGLGAKLSAVRVVAPVIRMLIRMSREQHDISLVCNMFRNLAVDDAPSVRRAAASQLGTIASAMNSPEIFAKELADVIWSLASDDNDFVRVEALSTLSDEILSQMPRTSDIWSAVTSENRKRQGGSTGSPKGYDESESLGTNDGDNDEEMLACRKDTSLELDLSDPAAALIAAAFEDSSWRVREAVALSFRGFLGHVQRRLSPAHCGIGQFLHLFALLLVDREVEVRVAAFESLNGVAAVDKHEFACDALCISHACRGVDPLEHPKVRISAAKALTRLLSTLSPLNCQASQLNNAFKAESRASESCAQHTVFDVIESHLFSNENVEVFLASLAELRHAIPSLMDELAQRVSQLIESSSHENWRVRRAIVEVIPGVAAKRGRDACEAHLLKALQKSFQDRVCQVRNSAVRALAALREIHGGCLSFTADWLMETVGKRLCQAYPKMPYYVYRITIVQALEQLVVDPSLSEHHLEASMQFLGTAAQDSVPNVRMAVVVALESAMTRACDGRVIKFARPLLKELLDSDPDPDVTYAVKCAMNVAWQ